MPMVDLQLVCRASEGSGEGQCLWLGHWWSRRNVREWVSFVLKSAARVTNVLVVSLDASCKKDCSHQDTETKASRREEHAG
jgi:hypothetical protein